MGIEIYALGNIAFLSLMRLALTLFSLHFLQRPRTQINGKIVEDGKTLHEAVINGVQAINFSWNAFTEAPLVHTLVTMRSLQVVFFQVEQFWFQCRIRNEGYGCRLHAVPMWLNLMFDQQMYHEIHFIFWLMQIIFLECVIPL